MRPAPVDRDTAAHPIGIRRCAAQQAIPREDAQPRRDITGG
ncbi:hypothetical protein [Gordonia westfalica]|nr:hypothetical protein [Gordonia westfalica]